MLSVHLLQRSIAVKIERTTAFTSAVQTCSSPGSGSFAAYRMDEDRIKAFAAEFDPQPFPPLLNLLIQMFTRPPFLQLEPVCSRVVGPGQKASRIRCARLGRDQWERNFTRGPMGGDTGPVFWKCGTFFFPTTHTRVPRSKVPGRRGQKHGSRHTGSITTFQMESCGNGCF